jgi:hypothetical protein
MDIEISQVRTFMECPQKWVNAYLKNRVTPPAQALRVGSLWHQAMERRLSGLSAAEAWQTIVEEHQAAFWPTTPSLSPVVAFAAGKAFGEFSTLKPAFMLWEPNPSWKIHKVEAVISRRLPNGIMLRGRIDCLVEWNGLFWHLQHKTIAASKPLAVYTRAMQRDWHECAYQWILEPNYPNYGGTLLNAVRKLSKKRMDEDPRSALHLEYIPRDRSLVDRCITDLLKITPAMHRLTLLKEPMPVQNRSVCGGVYGNSLCPYIDSCDGVATLSDLPLVDRTDPYDNPEPEDE